MPGHKRREIVPHLPYGMDITEIDGFDNLHDAEGILQEAQMRAAKLYGAQESFYLVNGSTCGLLASISAALPRGGRILVARNCHKAVYHGISLWNLKADYLYPKMTQMGILGDITPEMVAAALKKQDYDGILITSPTYDGVISDIGGIAAIAHSYGIPLIVDEAHGAHLGIHQAFPESAVTQGADLVVQSLHKTMPSLTMTALLHRQGDLVTSEQVQRYLNYYETSSPSYVLMAGMEACIRYVSQKKDILFTTHQRNLAAFYEASKALSTVHVILPDEVCGCCYQFDPSKIIITTTKAEINGRRLYELLLHKYGLQMEMCTQTYVLAMSSMMDDKDAYDRLMAALVEIDKSVCAEMGTEINCIKHAISYEAIETRALLPIGQAEDLARKERQFLQLEDAQDRIAAEFVYMYPPGIPVLAPGELITEQQIRELVSCKTAGFVVHGLNEKGQIPVLL